MAAGGQAERAHGITPRGLHSGRDPPTLTAIVCRVAPVDCPPLARELGAALNPPESPLNGVPR